MEPAYHLAPSLPQILLPFTHTAAKVILLECETVSLTTEKGYKGLTAFETHFTSSTQKDMYDKACPGPPLPLSSHPLSLESC